MGIIDNVYPTGVPVQKSNVISDDKTGKRRNMASVDDVRNSDLSGQTAGIYVRAVQQFYDLDTNDTTTPDDGDSCIIDYAGNRFKKIDLGGGSIDKAANYDWTGQHTFTKVLEVNPAIGTTDQGFAIVQEPSGTSTSSAYHAYNSIAVDNDDADTDGLTGANIAFSVTHNFGGSNTKGARIGNYTRVNLTAPTNSSNLAKEYVGVSGYCVALSDDGGTDLTTGARGSIFGANFVASVAPSIPNLFGVIGGEVNILLRAGSSSQRKIGWQIVAGADDAVQGATWDAALSISSQTGAVGWKDGIVFGNANGQFPMNSNGTILRATSGNATRGIDFASVTFSGTAFRSPGFSVGATGNINVGSSGSTNGTISFANATSGSVSLTPVSGALGSSVLSLPAKTGTLATTSDIRERLAGARTYYVRGDGSDSNNGLANTSGGAFLTIQKAIDVIVGTLDFSGFAVTIQIGDATYTGGAVFNGPWDGGGTLTIQGNSSTPSNVVISTTSASCFRNSGVLPGVLTVKDLEMRTTTSGSGIFNEGVGRIQYSNVIFGACATAHVNAAAKSAKITANGNYTINGNSPYHLLSLRGEIDISARTVTISGSPAFSAAFASALRLGYIGAEANTFSGSATGARYVVNTNAVLYTGGGGSTYLPGDSAGSAATGGLYA